MGIALGAGTAAGSFGQFVFAPFGGGDDRQFRLAQPTLMVFAGADAAGNPAVACAWRRRRSDTAADVPVAAAADRSGRRSSEAFGHRSYVLLVLGFFTCGFPARLHHHASACISRGPGYAGLQTGGWVIAVIGLFNIIGSLSGRLRCKATVCRSAISCRSIYLTRAMATVAFISAADDDILGRSPLASSAG